MIMKIFLLFAVALIAQTNAYRVTHKNGSITISPNDHRSRHNSKSSPVVNELSFNGSFVDFINMNNTSTIKPNECNWWFLKCDLPRIWVMSLRNVKNVSSVNDIPRLFQKASNVSDWLLSHNDKNYHPVNMMRLIVRTPLSLVMDVTRPSSAFRTNDAEGVIFYTTNIDSTYEITIGRRNKWYILEEWRLEVNTSLPVGIYLKEGKVGFWFNAQLASK